MGLVLGLGGKRAKRCTEQKFCTSKNKSSIFRSEVKQTLNSHGVEHTINSRGVEHTLNSHGVEC